MKQKTLRGAFIEDFCPDRNDIWALLGTGLMLTAMIAAAMVWG